MLLLKSSLLSLVALCAATTPAALPETEQTPTEYCYEVTIGVDIGGFGEVDTTVSACGSTPAEGLAKLGEAVRRLYFNEH